MEDNKKEEIEKIDNRIDNKEKRNDLKRIKKLIVLIILLIIIIVTSFKSGERFFEIRNSGFNDELNKMESDVAKWYFDARIVYESKEE